MPEQDFLVIAFSSWLSAHDDLCQFGMNAGLAQQALVDVRAKGAEFPGTKLADIVDDDLVHDGGKREFQGTDGAIRNNERTFFHKIALEMFGTGVQA